MKHISENDRNFRTILAKCEGILSQHLKVILIIATADSNKSLRTLHFAAMRMFSRAKTECFVLNNFRALILGLL